MNRNLNDSFIRNKINELDDTFPEELGNSEDLWEDINVRLKGKKKQSKIWKRLAIAASISLLIVAGIFTLTRKKHADEQITYKTETIQPTEPELEIVDTRLEEREALNYVSEQCKLEKPVCNSEEFIELKQQLNDVNAKIAEINKQQQLFGSDPALVKAQIAAENQKAYLLKELIQILRS